jgi:phage-related protein
MGSHGVTLAIAGSVAIIPIWAYYWKDMEEPTKLRRLYWVGSSKRDLLALPGEVVDVFGYALYLAQIGRKHNQAKPLQGFGSAGVLEIVEDWEGNAYRAVYTVRFEQAIYVLHVFQKKAKRGIATPKSELDIIRNRLKAAEQAARELES